MSFNKKNHKEAQSHGNIESMLRNKNGYNINKELQENNPDTVNNNQLESQHKGSSHSMYENQLEASRKGASNSIAENRLDTEPKMYNDKRNKDVWDTTVKPNDSLAQAYDNHKKEVFDEVERESKAAQQLDEETDFWDEFVGYQMLGTPTKIINNNEDSQLPNNPDRFKGLDKVKISVDPNETIESVLKDQDKFRKMVMASLSDADAMIYSIYKQANKESRKLTESEIKQINDINSGKARILSGHIELVD